jgi:hypothetical protein
MSEHLSEEELQSFAADLAGLDWTGFGVSGFSWVSLSQTKRRVRLVLSRKRTRAEAVAG